MIFFLIQIINQLILINALKLLNIILNGNLFYFK